MRKIKLQRTDGLPNFINYRYLLENQYVFFSKDKVDGTTGKSGLAKIIADSRVLQQIYFQNF